MARTILLVDDDALMRRSLAFHLGQAGYHVHTVANAEDALALVSHTPPDLVLLDIGLPEMDGLDALRELKVEKNLPVIFLTARRRELDEVLGLELGADDYITKPFEVDVVLARINDLPPENWFSRTLCEKDEKAGKYDLFGECTSKNSIPSKASRSLKSLKHPQAKF